MPVNSVASRPAVRPTTAPAPSTTRKPPSQVPVAGGWRGPTRAAQKPSLLPTSTLQTAPMTAIGPAKLPSGTIAGVKVLRATELEHQGLTGGNPLLSRTLDVQFGKVSQAQFEKLSAEFGGRSQVKYDAQREYGVVDFLPPTLQALVSKDLDVSQVPLKGTSALNEAMGNAERGDIELNSTPNCHGTAWESMRSFQGQPSTHVNLLFGDPQIVSAQYDDAAKFANLGVAEPGQPLDLSTLAPGDVVAFKRGEFELLHSAVYAGGGLFFEKPNTESDAFEESPYRLVTLDQATAAIQDLLGEPPSLMALRPKQQLAAGPEVFSAGEDAQKLEAWANKNGKTVGKQLVREFEVGRGGSVIGMHLNAVETKRVEIGPDGRGVIK